MAISHAGHDHPATPAGRRACRAGATQPVTKIGDVATYTGPAGKTMINPAKVVVMPRRPAVAARGPKTGCVQAALHTGGGRCACGWHTADYCDVSTWPCMGH